MLVTVTILRYASDLPVGAWRRVPDLAAPALEGQLVVLATVAATVALVGVVISRWRVSRRQADARELT